MNEEGVRMNKNNEWRRCEDEWMNIRMNEWIGEWVKEWIYEHSWNHLIPTTHGGTPLIATVYQDTWREEGVQFKGKKGVNCMYKRYLRKGREEGRVIGVFFQFENKANL